MKRILDIFENLTDGKVQTGGMQFVLFTFRKSLAAQLARYCLHRAVCFAGYALKANPS